MKAVIYARYSTDNQNAATIETQVEKCAEYAQEHGMDIIEIFADEAVSGMKSKRPQLNLLFQAAEQKRFDCVLIYDQSRFSRDIVDWFTFRRTMQNNDIQIISVTQPYVGGDLNDTAVFATEGINALVNQIHVLQTRQKTTDAMNRIAMQGLHTGGRPLLGYDVVDKHYVINEAEAQIVRLIFNLYADGKSYNNIIDTLNDAGYLTKSKKTFGKNSLYSILSNEKYIGTYTYNKIPPAKGGKRNSHAINPEMIKIKSAIPSIISEETWNTVHRRMQDKKRRPANTAKVEYLLSGKVYCGKCKCAMSGQRSKYIYCFYSCTGRQRLRNCDKKSIRKDTLENLVVGAIKSTLSFCDQREKIAQELFAEQAKLQQSINPSVKIIKQQLSDISSRIENINTAISEGIWSTSTIHKLKDLEKEKNRLYACLAETEKTKVSTDSTLDEILKVLEFLSDVDTENAENKRILLKFVEKVLVYEDYIDIIMNPLKKEVQCDIETSHRTSFHGAGDRT